MPNGIKIPIGDVKYKDVSTGAFSANTWYYYDVGGDSDLTDKEILGAFFSYFVSNTFITTNLVYNKVNKRFYYGATGSPTDSTLRILYKDFE